MIAGQVDGDGGDPMQDSCPAGTGEGNPAPTSQNSLKLLNGIVLILLNWKATIFGLRILL